MKKKATWRFRSMGHEVKRVVAEAPSLATAARQLDVDVATLHRWCREGKVVRPSRTRRPEPRREAARATLATLPAATWGESVRNDYDLSRTDEELVSLAETALELARDVTQKTADRLSAMAKFGAFVKQLNLETPEDGEAETTPSARPWPRRA